jgi:hypothetical protein
VELMTVSSASSILGSEMSWKGARSGLSGTMSKTGAAR